MYFWRSTHFNNKQEKKQNIRGNFQENNQPTNSLTHLLNCSHYFPSSRLWPSGTVYFFNGLYLAQF